MAHDKKSMPDKLIRREQDRQGLRDLLLDGAASPSGRPIDAAYFGGLRERLRVAGAGE